MDLRELDRVLGIDTADPKALRARRLVEADSKLLDDLVALREKRKLTQQELGERMGISQSAVARIEAGDRDPRLSTLRRYAAAVGAVVSHEVSDDEVTIRGFAGLHQEEAWDSSPVKRVSKKGAVCS